MNKYEFYKGNFLENGHTMFNEDVLKKLRQLEILRGRELND